MTFDPTRLSIAAWSAGIDYEADFWENWASTGGGRWPEDFAIRQQAERVFPADLEPLLDPAKANRVLDVGAGPMTVLGTRAAGRTIEVLASDPLANLYRSILDAHGITAPNPTVFATAEDLSAFFGCSTFDLVHCQNALDHSFDPARGIEEMLRVVKTGGHVVLRHFTNEADGGQYVGFHQFNFEERAERFYIWNKEMGFFPDERMECGTVFTTVTHPVGRSMEVVIRKTSEFEDSSDNSRFRQRVRELTEGLVGHYVSLSLDRLRCHGP